MTSAAGALAASELSPAMATASGELPGRLRSGSSPMPDAFEEMSEAPGENASNFELVPLRDFPHLGGGAGVAALDRIRAGDSVVGPLMPPGSKGWSGLKLYVVQNEHLSWQVKKMGGWQYDMLVWWCRALRSADDGHWVDVGGNLGAYAAPIACCLRGGECGAGAPARRPLRKVITAELDTSTRRVLEANAKINGLDNMLVFPFGVGAPEEVGTVGIHQNPKNLGGSAITRLDGAKSNSIAQITTLDSMLASIPSVMGAVLGMVLDVERHEYQALKGAHRFFTDSPPCWLQLEMPLSQQDWQPFDSMLSRYGYKNATEISRGAAMRKRSRMDVSAGNTDALYEQVDVPACISRTSRRARELRARYGELAGREPSTSAGGLA